MLKISTCVISETSLLTFNIPGNCSLSTWTVFWSWKAPALNPKKVHGPPGVHRSTWNYHEMVVFLPPDLKNVLIKLWIISMIFCRDRGENSPETTTKIMVETLQEARSGRDNIGRWDAMGFHWWSLWRLGLMCLRSFELGQILWNGIRNNR